MSERFPLHICSKCGKSFRGPEKICGTCVDALGNQPADLDVDGIFGEIVETHLLDIIDEDVAEILTSPGAEILEEVYGPDWRDAVREVPDVDVRREIEEANDVWASLRMDLAEAVATGRKSMRAIFAVIALSFFAVGFGAASLLWEVLV